MAEERWYKGSLHAHTKESDGDASPEVVAKWFADNGYDWLVISDHNLMTVLDNGPQAAPGTRPLMITGEEVTVELEGQPKAVYTNAVGIDSAVDPVAADGVVPTLQASVDAIVAAGGIASLTAPYFRPDFDPANLREVTGATLMEVFNAHPMNVHGDPTTFSYDGIWDVLLSSGRAVFGTASDDSHNYAEFGPDKANPGRAWVVARAAELSGEAIVESLVSGDFYASTGVSLRSVDASAGSIEIEIEESSEDSYLTSFIGRSGTVIGQEAGTSVRYRMRGDEGYVRARITSAKGSRAWTQPVFIEA